MDKQKNKHGLSRYIPDEIRLKIRQDSGFGCVVCGFAIAQYEHIDPSFYDAKAHDPDKMTFLCGTCHNNVTRKYWSKEKILIAKQNPFCLASGKCHSEFDVSPNGLAIWLGHNKFINSRELITVFGDKLLSVYPPETDGGPFRISGEFYDKDQKLLFKIIKNEWHGKSDNWDIDYEGGRITIKRNKNEIALQILCIPPDAIVIEKINMFYKGVQIIGDVNSFIIAFGITKQGFSLYNYEMNHSSININKDGSITITGNELGRNEMHIMSIIPDYILNLHNKNLFNRNIPNLRMGKQLD